MSDSVQLTLSISDPSIIKSIFDILLVPDKEEDTEIIPEQMIYDTDSAGIEYDEGIHSRGRSKLKDGTWKKRRQTIGAPPPPLTTKPHTINYSDFCDQAQKNNIDFQTINDAIETLGFPSLPVLATQEKDLYILLQKLL